MKLWFHENLRVFGDRLVDDKDRTHLMTLMYETEKGSLRVKEEMGFLFGDDPLFWTDILKGYGETAKRQYQESTSLQQVTTALVTFLNLYLYLYLYRGSVVLFKEAIQHTLRIVRVMRQPSGHMLLVGMGGTGKHTAARFAAFVAFVAEMELFELQPTKEYRMTDFRNDLKGLFKTAGLQGGEVMF
jgi:dynein heavy chain